MTKLSLFQRWLLVAALAIAAITLAPHARAQAQKSPEATAKEAVQKAPSDYAAGAWDRAITRLDKALKACGEKACSADVRAVLLLDKGVMLARKGSANDAAAAFGEALVLAPQITVPKSFDVASVRNAFAKGKEIAAKAQPAEGDFVHKAWTEQRPGVPLPVYVEYDGPVSKVVVRYRPVGDDEWKRVTLHKMGNGWGGVIPCADMDEGVLRYYVQGLDEDDLPVASSGSKNQPFKVQVHEDLEGPSPHLPGRHAPKSCSDGGCGKDPMACGADESSTAPTTGGGEGAEGGGGFGRVWIGIAGGAGFAYHGANDDVCLVQNGVPVSSKFYCTGPTDLDFPSRTSQTELGSLGPGRSGHVDGGLSPSAIRVMLTFDVALTESFMLGARIGYVMQTYPGQAAKDNGAVLPVPLHLEARGTYLFGNSPLSRVGFAPLAMLAVGATRQDTSMPVVVSQTGITGQRAMTAWQVGGPMFAGLGGGLRYALSQRVGFTTIVRFDVSFLGAGVVPTASLEAGLQYGF